MSVRSRQVAVTASALFMLWGTFYGFGLIGQRVEDSSGGAFAADATLVTPASPAFSIWSVIYLGLLGYVIWQWLPVAASSQRAARVWGLTSISMVLNGAWLLVTQAGWVWVSVLVIAALVLTLGVLVGRLGSPEGASRVERIIVDGTFGLYLGWVSVATIANVAAALVASGIDPGAGTPLAQALAVVVLAVGAGLGVLFARRLGGRLAVAAAMAWAMAWIAAGRLAGEPASTLVGVTAIVAAVVIVAVAGAARRAA